MAGYAVMPLADYQDACDAIREKDGSTGVIKSGEMGAKIRAIATSGGASGNPSDSPNVAVIQYTNAANTFCNGASENFAVSNFPDCEINGNLLQSGLRFYGLMYLYDLTNNTRFTAGVYGNSVTLGYKVDGETTHFANMNLSSLFEYIELNSVFQDEKNVMTIYNSSTRYAIQRMELVAYFPNGYTPST